MNAIFHLASKLRSVMYFPRIHANAKLWSVMLDSHGHLKHQGSFTRLLQSYTKNPLFVPNTRTQLKGIHFLLCWINSELVNVLVWQLLTSVWFLYIIIGYWPEVNSVWLVQETISPFLGCLSNNFELLYIQLAVEQHSVWYCALGDPVLLVNPNSFCRCSWKRIQW